MALVPMQIGVVFWAEHDPESHLAEIKSFGLNAGQFGIPPSMDTAASLEGWKSALHNSDIEFSGAVVSFEGETYGDIDLVHKTVGFTAPGYAAERIERTRQASDLAAALGLKALSCHIGFVPEDRSAPLYKELLDIAHQLCDICAANRQVFALETGQESATTLWQFLADVGRPNIKINFDPANMVMYGSGDPLEALKLLQHHVVSVHCKDGVSPPPSGGLGHEVPIGDGDVNFPGFLKQLKQMNYTGLLNIEREWQEPAQRVIDIRLAVERISAWKQAL
jgi:L-ribulose-5-phosphate 3-epimerase